MGFDLALPLAAGLVLEVAAARRPLLIAVLTTFESSFNGDSESWKTKISPQLAGLGMVFGW